MKLWKAPANVLYVDYVFEFSFSFFFDIKFLFLHRAAWFLRLRD